jgi:chromatin remodeling complex protein RSC6
VKSTSTPNTTTVVAKEENTKLKSESSKIKNEAKVKEEIPKKNTKSIKKEKVKIQPEVKNISKETIESTDKQSNSSEVASTGGSTVQSLLKAKTAVPIPYEKQQKKMTTNLKRVFKSYAKECKDLKKASTKNRKKFVDGNKPKRAPSGFAKPTQISNVLCDFLDVAHGSLMARTEVTKRVTKYIKEAKLQVPANRRRFVPDSKLASILGKLDNTSKGKDGKTDSEKGYTYFNLQKYLSPQFIKGTSTA